MGATFCMVDKKKRCPMGSASLSEPEKLNNIHCLYK
jgi:hypothetical protein